MRVRAGIGSHYTVSRHKVGGGERGGENSTNISPLHMFAQNVFSFHIVNFEETVFSENKQVGFTITLAGNWQGRGGRKGGSVTENIGFCGHVRTRKQSVVKTM